MQVQWLPSSDGLAERTKLNLSVSVPPPQGSDGGIPGTAAPGAEHMFRQIHLACHNAQRYAETSQRVAHCYG